ncbi:RusA family crossover junction endodeoxyribonuclease, partial [bacterium]|nr:RusA family crossover junction endodeoxyribonuclease [bacterium]
MYLPTKHPVNGFKAAIRAAFVANAGKWRTVKGPVRVGIHAWFEMPVSWSKKKRAAHDVQYHAQKPDADNVTKAVLDALT